jgi:dTDP-L-rhamnose 4-epimerase
MLRLSGVVAPALSTLDPVEHVLVTGGAGFVGSHVVDDLVDRGVTVTVLDNLDPAAHSERPTYLNANARYVWGDVRSVDAWRKALDGVDAVCHQAGKVGLGVSFDDADDYVTNNVNGWMAGLRVLHEQAFTGTVVLASSMVVYGEGRYRCAAHGIVRPAPRRAADLDVGNFECPCPQCGAALQPEAIPEDAPLEPRNVYAATKLSQEHLLESFAREHGNQSVALRYHNVYGPRMPRDTPYAGVASIFRSALAGGRAPHVTEDGNQMRNFVHVRDVSAANVAALGYTGAPGVVRAFNVASPTPRSVGEMARSLATAFGSGPGDDLWPVVTGRYRAGDVRHVFASEERARHELGFVGTVGFADGMAEFSTALLRAPVNVGSYV